MRLRCCSFYSAVNACSINHVQSFHFCKSLRKICCAIVFGVLVHSVISYMKTDDLPSKSWLCEQCFRVFLSLLVFLFSAHRKSNLAFWKRIVPTKHCSTMFSRLIINFLNHFKCCCGIKTGFPAKTNHCTLFSWFFFYDLWHGQNRRVTSRRKYFELKLGIRGEKGLLTNFLKFHGDRATSTMFSQHCCKTYLIDLVQRFWNSFSKITSTWEKNVISEINKDFCGPQTFRSTIVLTIHPTTFTWSYQILTIRMRQQAVWHLRCSCKTNRIVNLLCTSWV